MTRFLVALGCVALAFAAPALAQSNNDDRTPLGSRIKRDRQFPTDIVNRWRAQTTAVERARSRQMMSQFTKCVYNRSRTDALALLQKTDFGFVQFAQIGLDNERALRIYGFQDCLSRVAETHGTGVNLRWSPAGLRQWLVQEAYFARYGAEPSWVKPGYVIGPRQYPLSGQQSGVASVMDLADCVVASDPYTVDFYYRTTTGSEDEKRALDALAPMLGPCLPAGMRVQIDPGLMRVWMGEALWHAANNSAPAAVASSGVGQ